MITIEDIAGAARELNASDIHFQQGTAPVVRCDGEMRQLPEEYLPKDYEGMLLGILPPHLKQAFEQGEDADFAYTDEKGNRYRVNLFRKMGQLGCVMRLLAGSIPTLESLGMPQILQDFVMMPRGLVLVTGPTGSGKSTTLAAMIDYANEHRKNHIITIEDPVEYMHHNKQSIISQREVGRDVSGFAAALRSAMREDPDIILVGEMRDFETISSAITAAETGHLVLSTLHTTGAAKTIDRIIDVFPPHQQGQIRTQLAAVLRGVISQTLVPKIGGGRCAAFEIMTCTDAIANMIRDGKTFQIDSAMQTGQKDGMILLDRNLGGLVRDGIITEEEARSKCIRPDELLRYLKNS